MNAADIRGNPVPFTPLLLISPPTNSHCAQSVRQSKFPAFSLSLASIKCETQNHLLLSASLIINAKLYEESAPSCSLCALLLKRFMKSGTKQPRGTIMYGPDGNQRLPSIPRDEDVVLLLGLSINGWNETEKLLYGFQALCDPLRCNFGLFAAEGLNLPIVNLCPLHARVESLQIRPPRSLILLLGDFLGQWSNVTDLWSGFAHVSTVIVNSASHIVLPNNKAKRTSGEYHKMTCNFNPAGVLKGKRLLELKVREGEACYENCKNNVKHSARLQHRTVSFRLEVCD